MPYRPQPTGVAVLLAIVMLLCTPGCCIRTADLTLMATGNVNVDHVDLDGLPRQPAKGSDSTYVILGLIPLGSPSLEEAVDRALQDAGGDLLTDVVVHVCQYSFILFNVIKVEVAGQAVRTRGAAGGGR